MLPCPGAITGGIKTAVTPVAMLTHESGEAHLRREIDDLKKRIQELEDALREISSQLKAKGLFRPRALGLDNWQFRRAA